MRVTPSRLITSRLIKGWLVLAVAVAFSTGSAASSSQQSFIQTFTIKAELYPGQIEESVSIQFSNGERCDLQLDQKSPVATCEVKVDVGEATYWIEGYFKTNRDNVRFWQFWQSNTKQFTDDVGKKDSGKLHVVPSDLPDWRVASTSLAMIKQWNGLMAHYRRVFSDYHEEEFPMIEASEQANKADIANLAPNVYSEDYIDLVTRFGFPIINEGGNHPIAFDDLEGQPTAWRTIVELSNFAEKHFTPEQINILKDSRVYLRERGGEIVEYFNGASSQCPQGTSRLWIAELMHEDIVHNTGTQKCYTLLNYLHEKLSDIDQWVTPSQWDIVYQPSPEPIQLVLYYWQEDDETDIDYYLVRAKE